MPNYHATDGTRELRCWAASVVDMAERWAQRFMLPCADEAKKTIDIQRLVNGELVRVTVTAYVTTRFYTAEEIIP